MKVPHLLVVALSVLLMACTTSSYLDKPLPPTPDSKEIEVVVLADVGRKYTIIGDVTGMDIGDLKKAARKLGADAISLPVNRGYFFESQAIKYK